jgi:hypothetical protein
MVKFCALYGTLSHTVVLTKARYWSVSWASLIRSTPSHPICLRSILILFFHLRLDIGLQFTYLQICWNKVILFPPQNYMRADCSNFKVTLSWNQVNILEQRLSVPWPHTEVLKSAKKIRKWSCERYNKHCSIRARRFNSPHNLHPKNTS